MYGNYSGGGVCIDCLHHTTGINCKTCEPFYYNPKNISMLSNKACRTCNCSPAGSRKEPQYEFLDCLKSDSFGMVAGDCFCKANVIGNKCQSCRIGYFNISANNVDGCQRCDCLVQGTLDGDTSCSQSEGQCVCKNNTIGLKCQHCKDNFYNLTMTNEEGCTMCECNPGGSRSSICNKQEGTCTCHSDLITGRQCNKLQPGFFYPSLDFIRDDELVKYNLVVMAWRGTLSIPSAGRNVSVMRFAFQCTSNVSVYAIISAQTTTQSISDQVLVDSDCKNCYIVSTTEFLIGEGLISVEITFPSITNNFADLVRCSSLIGIPRQFYASELITKPKDFYSNCVLTMNMSYPICQDETFTATMDYLHRPFPCNCHTDGALDAPCNPHHGQCSCKPGVTGRTCNICQRGYYNFTKAGCTLCDCFGIDGECDSNTGQCNCEPNTFGRKCDTCTPFYWNITKGVGCVHCNCSSAGAMDGQCDSVTGQCQCRVGVQGRGCDSCLPGYKDLSSQGCKDCGCSEKGSLSSVCNPFTGQCPCKNRTTGMVCDQCIPGSFHLNMNSTGGCLECFCSGVSTNCSTAVGRWSWQYSNLSHWKLIRLPDNNNSNSNNNSYNTYVITRSISDGSAIEMLSAPIVSHSRPLYWRFDSGFFNGEGVLSYNGLLNFYLEISITNAENYVDEIPMKVELQVSVHFLLYNTQSAKFAKK